MFQRLAPLCLLGFAGVAAAQEATAARPDLVVLEVQVVDKKGRYVDDARAEDFRVREDGAEQKVEFFERAERPVSYGVVVDNSGSMRKLFDLIARAGESIVAANRPQDEAFVTRFVGTEQMETLAEFTSNRETLRDAFAEMRAEGGQTAVIDAAYAAVERAAAHREGEANRARAVVLVTDGEDRSSRHTGEQLAALLRGSNVRVFVIGLIYSLDNEGGLIKRSPRERAGALLDSLAETSGGRAFYPKNGQELQQAVAEINRGLRAQYLVGYVPTDRARDGKLRKLKVDLADAPGRQDRKALTRSGRVAPK